MSDDDARQDGLGHLLVTGPTTYAELATLAELGAVQVEFNREGGLSCVTFPVRRERRRVSRLRNGEPAGPEPANATGADSAPPAPSTPGTEGAPAHPPIHHHSQPGECPACGKSVQTVVITDGTLAATVFVDTRDDMGVLTQSPDGLYQESECLVLHAPRCPKWDGDMLDWRTHAVRIPR